MCRISVADQRSSEGAPAPLATQATMQKPIHRQLARSHDPATRAKRTFLSMHYRITLRMPATTISISMRHVRQYPSNHSHTNRSQRNNIRRLTSLTHTRITTQNTPTSPHLPRNLINVGITSPKGGYLVRRRKLSQDPSQASNTRNNHAIMLLQRQVNNSIPRERQRATRSLIRPRTTRDPLIVRRGTNPIRIRSRPNILTQVNVRTRLTQRTRVPSRNRIINRQPPRRLTTPRSPNRNLTARLILRIQATHTITTRYPKIRGLSVTSRPVKNPILGTTAGSFSLK